MKKKKYGQGILLYEIQYYLEQLNKGDHVVIESLARLSHTTDNAWESKTFDNLRTDSSNYYFSKSLLFHYFGVTKGLLGNALGYHNEGDKTKENWCIYLSYRLITQAERILIKNEMPDSKLIPEEVNKLQALKNGVYDSLEAEITSIENKIETLKESIGNIGSNEETKIALSNWLIGLRKAMI